MKTYAWMAMLCGGLSVAANAQTLIDGFEYATTEDLQAVWMGSGGATLSLSDSVAPKSTGKKSLQVDFSFPSTAWATETIKQVDMPNTISLSPTQYVTFRLRGDPNFAVADFRNLYLYVYDADGNFARWPGVPTPLTTDWTIINNQTSTNALELPWDSTTMPDLSRVSRFAFYQYGSQAAIDAYTATILLDDLMIRDSPLNEFPPASPARELIDDFESYKDDAALRAFYTYENSPATTATTVSLSSPAPQGTNALKLAIDFAAGQWPWGSAWSATVSPFSIPTNAVVSFQIKGDPALAAISDSGTVFRLRFTDKSGNHIDYWSNSGSSAPVISSNWTTIEATLTNFDNVATTDIGNLIQWQLLVQGWQGTADSAAMSAAFYIDDLRITVPSTNPKLTMVKQGANLSLLMEKLIAGKTYDLRTCTDLSKWSSATTFTATSTSQTWPVTPTPVCSFYHLQQK